MVKMQFVQFLTKTDSELGPMTNYVNIRKHNDAFLIKAKLLSRLTDENTTIGEIVDLDLIAMVKQKNFTFL